MGGRAWGPLIPDEGGVAAGKPVSRGSDATHDDDDDDDDDGCTLNDLARDEWRQFSQRVIVGGGGRGASCGGSMSDDVPRSVDAEHPDGFPGGLAECMVRFFTRRGGTVLDPFAGTGGTLAACNRAGRIGLGIELYEKWAGIARNHMRQKVVCADSIDAREIVERAEICGSAAGVDMLLGRIAAPDHGSREP